RSTTRRELARRHDGISLRDATGPGHATRGKPAGRRGIAGVGSGAPAVEADGATGFATVNVHGGGSRDAGGWSLAGCDAAGIQPERRNRRGVAHWRARRGEPPNNGLRRTTGTAVPRGRRPRPPRPPPAASTGPLS